MNDHPYFDEVKFSLELFNNQGFEPVGCDNGEEYITTFDIDTIIADVLSVDEAYVDLNYQGKNIRLFFVLGNEPGVAICDYSYPKELGGLIDGITDTIYNHFN
jgi:hypothetical protein